MLPRPLTLKSLTGGDKLFAIVLMYVFVLFTSTELRNRVFVATTYREMHVLEERLIHEILTISGQGSAYSVRAS